MLDGEKYQIYKAMSICRHYERNTPGMASLDRKPLDLNVERYKVYSPNGVKYMYIYIIYTWYSFAHERCQFEEQEKNSYTVVQYFNTAVLY